MDTEVKQSDLVIRHVFDAPVEQVWQAWSDPQQVVCWWGPTGFTSPSAEIDFREGGKFLFCMRPPKEWGNQDLYTAGVYTKIVPLERIDFTQMLSDQDGNAIDPTSINMPADFPPSIPCVLQFKRQGNQTELTVIEYGWAAGQMREMSRMGMEQCLDKLAECLK